MSDFAQVTKKLDITKVVKDTTYVTKPLSHVRARHIKKLNTIIRLKSYYHSLMSLPPQQGMFGFQYNVAFGEEFTIVHIEHESHGVIGIVQAGCLTVKWRVDSTVYRYILTGRTNNQIMNDLVVFPWYNNETIKPNCVFEYWYAGLVPEDNGAGLLYDLDLTTSKLNVPTSCDETEVAEEYTAYSHDILGYTLVPEVIPTPQVLHAFDNNT